MWPGWGPATIFTQAVGLGATRNDGLLRRVGDAVAQETRAMRARDDRVGLNVWAPTVSLLRHPLWGQERGGLRRGPAPDGGDRHGVHPRPTRRRPGVLDDGPRPQALAGPQQRDGQVDFVLLGTAEGPPRVRHARLPPPRRGRRRGRGDARVQPRQRAAEPCLAVPAGTPSDLDGPGNCSPRST